MHSQANSPDQQGEDQEVQVHGSEPGDWGTGEPGPSSPENADGSTNGKTLLGSKARLVQPGKEHVGELHSLHNGKTVHSTGDVEVECAMFLRGELRDLSDLCHFWLVTSIFNRPRLPFRMLKSAQTNVCRMYVCMYMHTLLHTYLPTYMHV